MLNLDRCCPSYRLKVNKTILATVIENTHGRVNKCHSVKWSTILAPCKLEDLHMPKYADIMCYYYWLWRDLDVKRVVVFNQCMILKVVENVFKIWINTIIPLVFKWTINGKNMEYCNKCWSLEKSHNHLDIKQKTTLEEFVRIVETFLFDIASCKCKDLDNCSCDIRRKVTEWEVKFLRDQRAFRKMVMRNNDLKARKKKPCKDSGTGNRKWCKFIEGPSKNLNLKITITSGVHC